MKQLHIEGRRWFQKTYGNTYHSVRIWADGKQIAHLPYQYGYGEQWLQTALDWLREQGHISSECYRCGKDKALHSDTNGCVFMAHYGTLYLRETLGGTYSVIDVDRKREL
jgi:hypothetical protein